MRGRTKSSQESTTRKNLSLSSTRETGLPSPPSSRDERSIHTHARTSRSEKRHTTEPNCRPHNEYSNADAHRQTDALVRSAAQQQIRDNRSAKRFPQESETKERRERERERRRRSGWRQPLAARLSRSEDPRISGSEFVDRNRGQGTREPGQWDRRGEKGTALCSHYLVAPLSSPAAVLSSSFLHSPVAFLSCRSSLSPSSSDPRTQAARKARRTAAAAAEAVAGWRAWERRGLACVAHL